MKARKKLKGAPESAYVLVLLIYQMYLKLSCNQVRVGIFFGSGLHTAYFVYSICSRSLALLFQAFEQFE